MFSTHLKSLFIEYIEFNQCQVSVFDPKKMLSQRLFNLIKWKRKQCRCQLHTVESELCIKLQNFIIIKGRLSSTEKLTK